MPSNGKALVAARARTVPPVHQLVVAVPCSLECAARAVIAALTTRGFTAREDESFALLAGGPSRVHSARRILAVDPRHVSIIAATDDSALIEIPIAFLVMPSHGGITVRCNDPAVSLAGYSGLAELAEELSATCQRILRAVIHQCGLAATSGDTPAPLSCQRTADQKGEPERRNRTAKREKAKRNGES